MVLTTAPTIPRWKRFEQRGMAGLDLCHKGSQPRVANAAMPRITRKTQQKPADDALVLPQDDGGSGTDQVDHAPRMGTGRLKAHRLDRYMASDDSHSSRRLRTSWVST